MSKKNTVTVSHVICSWLVVATFAQAQSYTWTQITAATQNWNTAGNWLASTPYVSGSGNELIFFANTTTALTNGINAITTNVPNALAMNTLTLNGRGNAATASTAVVNIASNASTWTIGDGSTSRINLNGIDNLSNGTAWSGLYLKYNVAANLVLNQTSTLIVGNGNSEFHFSGNIGEAAAGYGLTKEGSSILTLSGANSYSGGSVVTGGAVIFRNVASKPSSGTHSFAAGTTVGLGVGDAGFFSATDLDNAFANAMTGNLAGITRDAAANFGIDTTAGNFVYASNIPSASNGLVKLGANTLTLTGSNAYTGATSIFQGILEVDTLADGGLPSDIGAATAGATGLVLNGGTLRYIGATAATNRGLTHAGNTNSVVSVVGPDVALSMGDCVVANIQALTINGGARTSLILGAINALAAANQANFVPNIPTTLGAVNYAYNAGQFTIANRGTSTLTYGDITGPGTTQALFIGGQGTVNGVISGFTGNFIIGAGGSTVSVLGPNTFTGLVDIRQATTVVYNTIKNVGGGASSFGAPTTGTGTIIFGQLTNNQTLRYVGTGDSTNRQIRLAGTGGTVTLEQAGTGLLKFTSAFTSTGDGSKTVGLSGSTTGTGEIAGAIVDRSSTFKTSVSKTGTGTWTLSGVNPYTGTTTVSAGTLALTAGSLASPITVAAAGTLGFMPGSTYVSSSSVSFAAGAKVSLVGTATAPTEYLLMTAAGGITGTPTVQGAAVGYSVEIRNGGTELWLDFNPNLQAHVIDLGTGTAIEGSSFGVYAPSPTGLPLPTLPAGTILRSVSTNTIMTESDAGNYASDLTLLFDPTPSSPGGDFSLALASTASGATPFGATHKITWPASADNGAEGTLLVNFSSQSAWAAHGPIDLSSYGIFLGNSYGTAPQGGTWSGTITLIYELPASGYSTWSGGAAAQVDSNNDGVTNGVAWVVGAAGPSAVATGQVPTFDNTSDPDFFLFQYRRSDVALADSKTVIKAQYSSDLTTWNDATAGANVIITPTNDFYTTGIDKVEVKIRRTLAVSGKLFTRLHVVILP